MVGLVLELVLGCCCWFWLVLGKVWLVSEAAASFARDRPALTARPPPHSQTSRRGQGRAAVHGRVHRLAPEPEPHRRGFRRGGREFHPLLRRSDSAPPWMMNGTYGLRQRFPRACSGSPRRARLAAARFVGPVLVCPSWARFRSRAGAAGGVQATVSRRTCSGSATGTTTT